jgi:hypothetical protein
MAATESALEDPQPKLIEAFRLCAPVQGQRYTGEDRAAPEAQCFLRESRGSGVVAGGRCLAGLLNERLEDLRVENGPAKANPIPASASFECHPVRRELTAAAKTANRHHDEGGGQPFRVR